MILRSITKHIKEQNWFAVFTDFFIVVVGVFIGIQVANWNASLGQIERANGYLERLEADLANDLETIKSRQKFYSDVLLHGNRALAYAEAKEQDRKASWPVILDFFQASQIFSYYPSDATYTELKSGGELNLIENADLRSNLTKYYLTGTGQYDFAFRGDPKYRETIRGLTPSIVTRFIWENCHEESQFNEQRFLECDFLIEEAEVKRILDTYISRPEVTEELRFWVSTLQTTKNLLEVTSNGAQSLIDSINNELSKR
jgi:hypothetical protein